MSRWFLLQCEAERHIQFVLAKSEDMEQPDQNGETPLMLAAFHGLRSKMKTLLKRGAEVNAVSPQGVTPLMCAALYANWANMQMLLKHGAQLECDAHTDGRLLEAAVSSRGVLTALTVVRSCGFCWIRDKTDFCKEIPAHVF